MIFVVDTLCVFETFYFILLNLWFFEIIFSRHSMKFSHFLLSLLSNLLLVIFSLLSMDIWICTQKTLPEISFSQVGVI
jgi:hypothetical protein